MGGGECADWLSLRHPLLAACREQLAEPDGLDLLGRRRNGLRRVLGRGAEIPFGMVLGLSGVLQRGKCHGALYHCAISHDLALVVRTGADGDHYLLGHGHGPGSGELPGVCLDFRVVQLDVFFAGAVGVFLFGEPFDRDDNHAGFPNVSVTLGRGGRERRDDWWSGMELGLYSGEDMHASFSLSFLHAHLFLLLHSLPPYPASLHPQPNDHVLRPAHRARQRSELLGVDRKDQHRELCVRRFDDSADAHPPQGAAGAGAEIHSV